MVNLLMINKRFFLRYGQNAVSCGEMSRERERVINRTNWFRFLVPFIDERMREEK